MKKIKALPWGGFGWAFFVNEEKPAGTYEVEFNATSFTSGIYFYQIKAGEYLETKKMILLR